MREAIEQALDEYARPILREHCGEVEVTGSWGHRLWAGSRPVRRLCRGHSRRRGSGTSAAAARARVDSGAGHA
jgi:hypothetical protein